jgi:hypothetical protein
MFSTVMGTVVESQVESKVRQYNRLGVYIILQSWATVEITKRLNARPAASPDSSKKKENPACSRITCSLYLCSHDTTLVVCAAEARGRNIDKELVVTYGWD